MDLADDVATKYKEVRALAYTSYVTGLLCAALKKPNKVEQRKGASSAFAILDKAGIARNNLHATLGTRAEAVMAFK